MTKAMTKAMTRKQAIKKVTELYHSGVTIPEISSRLGLGKSTVYLWIKLQKQVEKTPVRVRHSTDTIETYCKRVRAGEKQVDVCRDMGINPATGSVWLKNHPREIAHTYTTAFKRNVIGSLQSGRSTYEVQKTFNITHTELSKWIEEYKDGKYDTSPTVQVALKSSPVVAPAEDKPAIQTMSVAALDTILDVVKLLTAKGLNLDVAMDVSKSIVSKLK
jgi:transposase